MTSDETGTFKVVQLPDIQVMLTLMFQVTAILPIDHGVRLNINRSPMWIGAVQTAVIIAGRYRGEGVAAPISGTQADDYWPSNTRPLQNRSLSVKPFGKRLHNCVNARLSFCCIINRSQYPTTIVATREQLSFLDLRNSAVHNEKEASILVPHNILGSVEFGTSLYWDI